MKVLLIAHAYPPAPASGAQRAANVARALRAAGADVRVITLRAGARDRKPTDPDDDVIEVGMWPSGADLLNALARGWRRIRRVARPAPPGEGASAPRAEDPSLAADVDPMDPGPRFRRWVSAVMRFPNGQLGFLGPAVRAALQVGGWPDVVYTTGPPVTTQLAGLLLHAMRGIPWVAEYRDPWIVNGAPYRAPSHRTRLTDEIERLFARLCHATAAEVVAVSEGIARVVDAQRSAVGRPTPHVVLNGIPVLSPRGVRHARSGPLRILHLGNVYAFRDPRPFFVALAALCSERTWGPEAVQVEFVGDPPPPRIRAHVDMAGLGDIVHFVDWVPHATGQARVRNADILLLLAQRQPMQVPNKLYEYLGSRNPILAFADARGETARMVRQAGRHALVTEHDDAARVRVVVAGLLDDAQARRAGQGDPPSVADDPLVAWTTGRQLAALSGILERARLGLRH